MVRNCGNCHWYEKKGDDVGECHGDTPKAFMIGAINGLPVMKGFYAPVDPTDRGCRHYQLKLTVVESVPIELAPTPARIGTD